MSDESQTETATETTTETAAKKKVRRKPVHVFVPVTPTKMSLLDDDGMEITVYTIPEGVTPYVAHVIEGGKGQADGVRGVLKEHDIDPTNLGDVLLFRATPVDFRIEQQLIVRF